MKLAVVISTPEVATPPPVALLSGSFQERLAKAAAIGYQGVELMCARPAALDPAWVARELRAQCLEAPAFGTGALFISEGLTLLHEDAEMRLAAMKRAEQLVDLAAAVCQGTEGLGPIITIGSFRGRVATMGGAGPGREALAAALVALARYAAKAGVRLALEPLNRYEADLLNTAEEALAFVAELGEENVGLLLDTFHVNIEEPDPNAAVAQTRGRLWHVHLGDSNREPPGRGHFDFAAFVAALRQAGYNGYLSAELLARPDADAAARLTYCHMAPLLGLARP